MGMGMDAFTGDFFRTKGELETLSGAEVITGEGSVLNVLVTSDHADKVPVVQRRLEAAGVKFRKITYRTMSGAVFRVRLRLSHDDHGRVRYALPVA